MEKYRGLEQVLKEAFTLHGSRLNFISRFIMTVIVEKWTPESGQTP